MASAQSSSVSVVYRQPATDGVAVIKCVSTDVLTSYQDTSERIDSTTDITNHSNHNTTSEGIFHNTGVTDTIITSSHAEGNRNFTTVTSGWQKRVKLTSTPMTDLGKKRFLARYLLVPEEANTKFTQIQETLEADIRTLTHSLEPCSQILWSCRLCMIGVRSGTVINAEPTILISCGSSAWKRKIKENLLRIRPYYLEHAGFPLIVRYDRSAPVLAGLGEASSPELEKAVPLGHTTHSLIEPINVSSQNEQGVIRLEINAAETSCGLKLAVESKTFQPPGRKYATLGGVIKIGGVWYGMTAAHSIVASFSSTQNHSRRSNTEHVSAQDGIYDSTEEEEDEDFDTQEMYNEDLQAGSHRHSSFMRLIGVWPGGFMAHSFNGACRSSLGETLNDSVFSDWAVLEITETYVRPNMYVNPTEGNKGSEALYQEVKNIVRQSQINAGPVYVLYDAQQPCTGHLTTNRVSLQLTSGPVEVYEVFLNQTLMIGASGSWVVRGEHLIGMLIAIGDHGSSCFIIPVCQIFDHIQSVCGRTAELTHAALPTSAAFNAIDTVNLQGLQGPQLSDPSYSIAPGSSVLRQRAAASTILQDDSKFPKNYASSHRIKFRAWITDVFWQAALSLPLSRVIVWILRAGVDSLYEIEYSCGLMLTIKNFIWQPPKDDRGRFPLKRNLNVLVVNIIELVAILTSLLWLLFVRAALREWITELPSLGRELIRITKKYTD